MDKIPPFTTNLQPNLPPLALPKIKKLSFIILNFNRDIARYILGHDLWREALRNHVSPKKKHKRSSRKIVTPMRRLIRDMPGGRTITNNST